MGWSGPKVVDGPGAAAARPGYVGRGGKEAGWGRLGQRKRESGWATSAKG